MLLEMSLMAMAARAVTGVPMVSRCLSFLPLVISGFTSWPRASNLKPFFGTCWSFWFLFQFVHELIQCSGCSLILDEMSFLNMAAEHCTRDLNSVLSTLLESVAPFSIKATGGPHPGVSRPAVDWFLYGANRKWKISTFHAIRVY